MSEDITPKPVQPVSDNGGALSVDDNGGSLTVDGTVAISGSVATTGGGGTEYAEDAAHANGDAGKLILAVRRDTGAAFTSTDGDYTAIAADSNGRVKVVHDQALPAGANVIGTVTIQDGGNVISIDDAGGSITVDGPLTDSQLRATPVPVSGTVTANAGTGPYPVTDNGGSLTVDGSVAADTELPAAAALADGAGNPTTPTVGSAGLMWNGTGWDRLKGDTTSGLWVNVKNTSLAVTGTFWQATQPVSLASLPALSAGTAAIGKLAANDGVDIGDVTINNASLAVTGTFWQATQPVSIASAVPVTDNSGSLTVDSAQLPTALAANGGLKIEGVASGVAVPVSGTFFQATQPVSGTVTANAGTGPFPVSDNAGSLTVDAPVGTPVFTRLSDGTAALTTTSGRLAVDASGAAVPITDDASSLTVDAPVGTPAFVRLSDGAAAITTLPVSVAAAATSIAKAEDAAAADGDVGVPALLRRLDDAQAAAALTSTDGDYTVGTADSKGRRRVTISGESFAQVTGNLTASGAGTDPQTSSSTSVIVVPVADTGNLTIQVSGTYGAGAVLQFEGSITTTGTGWAAVGAVREDTQWAETSSRLPANATRQWTMAVPGYKYIRIRCSTFVSGTLAITANPGGWLIEPVQPGLPTGRVIVGVNSLTKTVTTTDAVPTADLIAVRDYVAAAAVNSVTITAGKRMRLTQMTVAMRGAGTPVAAGFTARLRVNPAGAAVVTSPIVAEASIASTAALAVGAAQSKDVPLDVDMNDAAQWTISVIGVASSANTIYDVLLQGYEY